MRLDVGSFELSARFACPTHCARTVLYCKALASQAMLRNDVELPHIQTLPTCCAPLASRASMVLSLRPMLDDAGFKAAARLRLLADVAHVPWDSHCLLLCAPAREADQQGCPALVIVDLLGVKQPTASRAFALLTCVRS